MLEFAYGFASGALLVLGIWMMVDVFDKPHTPATCPSDHTAGLVYDETDDVMTCPLCGHQQWEEMGV